MVRFRSPRGQKGKAKNGPRAERAALATRPERAVLATRLTSRNPQSLPDSSGMPPETQVGTRSSTRARRQPPILGNYEVTRGRRHPSSATSEAAPQPPPNPALALPSGAQPPMIPAGNSNLQEPNGNETNPAKNAGDEGVGANNVGAVDVPADNHNRGDDDDDERVDLEQSSDSDSNFSDDADEDSEEEVEVEDASR